MKFQNKQHIEIIYINEEPYFKAKDVCQILGFKNHKQAVENHCEKKGVISKESLTKGGMQNTNFINERNLYALIFNVPKKFQTDTEEVKKIKDRAKMFQDWIFSDVLPTLRKTGKYEIEKTQEDNLLKHLNIELQKQNVKIINAIKNKEGGVPALKEYHNEICKLHTGKSATELKKIAKDSGKYKSNVYNSARAVIRNTDKPISASMSITDQLAKANKGKSLREIYEISKLSIPLFRALEESKLEHNFKELEK